MRKLLLTGFLLSNFFVALSQIILESDAESAALSFSTTARISNASVFYNPGIYRKEKSVGFVFGYSNRLNLKGFSRSTFVLSGASNRRYWSFGLQQEGWQYYRLTHGVIGYGYRLKDNLSAGISGSAFWMNLGNYYGQNWNLTANLGLYYEASKRLQFGVAIFNLKKEMPNTFRLKHAEELLRVGLAYHNIEKFTFYGDLDFAPKTGAFLNVGCSYQIVEKFALMTGIRTLNNQFSFGFSFHYHNWKLVLSNQWIQRLGWIPHFGLIFR